MTNDLKSKVLSVIKLNSVERNITVKDGRSFKAQGITFQNICNAFGEQEAQLGRLRQIKREVVNLVAEDFIMYIFGEPPCYILKDSIDYD